MKSDLHVIERNFLRLLRSGTFGGQDPLEPLSPWKWKRLYQIALMHGVGALVYDGIRNYKDDFFLQLDSKQREQWEKTANDTERNNQEANIAIADLFNELNHQQVRPILLKGQSFAQLYPIPGHRTCGDIDIYFPYPAQADKADLWAKNHCASIENCSNGTVSYQFRHFKIKHRRQLQKLTNPILNKRLQQIISQETRCCDSCYTCINGIKVECIPHTVNLLVMLVRITRYILNEGISLKQIIDLGMFLRKEGDKVDYVKLQMWLTQLHMQSMAQMIGSLLVIFFLFSKDEIPFMSTGKRIDVSAVTAEVFRISGNHSYEWYFTQGKDIFVRSSNSSAMFWQMRHSTRYFRYYPSEMTTNFLTTFAQSLSHIEE